MNININLAELGFNYDPAGNPQEARTLQDLIIAGAVAQILEGTDIASDARTAIRVRVGEVAEKMVREHVTEAFNAPIQRTTQWGEDRGEPTTVREIIRESVESYLNAPASRDNRGSAGNSRNLSELINEETKNILERDMKAVIAEAKKTVTAKVTAEAVQAASAAITAQFSK